MQSMKIFGDKKRINSSKEIPQHIASQIALQIRVRLCIALRTYRSRRRSK